MKFPRNLIVAALLEPHTLERLTARQWDLLVRQGRRANLLARLAADLTDSGRIGQVPRAPRAHLQSALLVARRQETSVRLESARITREVADAGAPVVLLKGAAYVMANLPVGRGRLFSDIDILVPKAAIGHVEAELMIHGWQGTNLDEYDQNYYRRWMHELPPMRHVRRGTNIDVHHTILPETARVKVNTGALFETIVPVTGVNGAFVLHPVDMFLHSAAHLFHEGEFDNGLRDLFDLDSLLRHFGADPSFSPTLVPRARHLGLTRPLFYALRYTREVLSTPIPERVVHEAEAAKPNPMTLAIMDACFRLVFRPLHDSCKTRGTWLARACLYVRSHWIRMPIHLLAYHLGRKALLRPKTAEEKKAIADAAVKA